MIKALRGRPTSCLGILRHPKIPDPKGFYEFLRVIRITSVLSCLANTHEGVWPRIWQSSMLTAKCRPEVPAIDANACSLHSTVTESLLVQNCGKYNFMKCSLLTFERAAIFFGLFFFWCVLNVPVFLKHVPSFVPTFHWHPFLFASFCCVLVGCIALWLVAFDFPPVFLDFVLAQSMGFVHATRSSTASFLGCCYLLLYSMVCGHWSYSCVICLHSLGFCFFGQQNRFRSTTNVWRLRLHASTEVMLPNKVHGYRL